MSFRFNKQTLWPFLCMVIIFALALPGVIPARRALASATLDPDAPEDSGSAPTSVYVPFVFADYPWESPFGIESSRPILSSNGLMARATDLNIAYVRTGNQISWAELQPAPGVIPQWGLLADFENELRELNQAGITPIVTIKNTPVWAQKPGVRDDGQPTSCGAIAEEYFDEFASFVQEMVNRYKTPEFNAHIWEIGNEPDVDPNEVPPDFLLGCWGDIDDTAYFGGYYYAQMLRVVSIAIKEADSTAQVWVGGLLLDRPVTDPSDADEDGYAERFFTGILQETEDSGAGPSFDVAPYHAYSTYWDQYAHGVSNDYDLLPSGQWYAWGGGVIGKARFLRQHMAQYGVDKPIFLNETGFGCADTAYYCDAPDERFFESQATHLVRYFARGLSENVPGFIWYTLDGPGWRFSSLLDGSQLPRLSYTAFQVISQQLQHARYIGTVDYAEGIEAYAFHRNSEQVQIVWAKEDETIPFYVPANKFIMALSREGVVLYVSTYPPPEFGTEYKLQAGFEPIYVIRYP